MNVAILLVVAPEQTSLFRDRLRQIGHTVVTATVTDPDDMATAATAIEHLGGASRLVLRPAFGQQATGFLAGLPLGIVLAAHVRVPEAIRDAA